MIIRDLLDRVEKEFAHQYESDLLIAWLNELERDIEDFLSGFEGNEDHTFTPHTSVSDSLQIEEPQIYLPFLIAQVCLANEEYDRYNNHVEIFLAKYQDWKDRYIRKHMPVSRGKLKL